MHFNFYVPFLAALIPLLIGFIWYNPKVFGKAWMKAAEITEDKMKGANMAVMFGVTYLLSLFAAFAMIAITIHQTHLFSMMANEPGIQDPASEAGLLFKSLVDKFGTNFRTFKHGAFHGVLMGLMLALPVLGINAIFERRNFKYIAINVGFWIVCLALMGGTVCCCF
jgi:hypothetical protein